ncbi:MAG: leucine-rich repeat protein [Clostridia bacterium]|nr:leucine-rich repeat protein [Clostridia bacterium]
MKHFIQLFIVSIMLSVSTIWCLLAYAEVYGDYLYTIEDGTAIIDKYQGIKEYLTLPEQINGYPVVATGLSTFEDCTSLRTIKFPAGFKRLGTQAFWKCTHLENVILPETLESIGDNVFYKCESLNEINFPDNIAYIGSNTFNECPAILYSHINSKTATSLGWHWYSFIDKNYRGLVLKYKEGKSDQLYLISTDETLSELIIPNSVVGLELFAIKNDEAKLICDANSTAAKAISEQVHSFVEKDNPSIFLRWKRLTGTDTYELAVTGVDKTVETISIPDTVKIIDDYSFMNCSVLHSVTIPNTVNSIGTYAFAHCKNLKKLFIPNSVTRIGDNALTSYYSPTVYCYEYSYAESWARQHGFDVFLLDGKPFEQIGSVSLPADKTIPLGKATALVPDIFPKTADLSIEWSSSNPEVATIDNNGIVSPNHTGETTITLKVNSLSAQMRLTVVIPASSFSLPEKLYVEAKSTASLPAPEVTPSNAFLDLDWSIADTVYASITSTGYIESYAIGETTLTATDTLTGLTQTAAICIIAPVSTLTVSPESLSLIPYEASQLSVNSVSQGIPISTLAVTYQSENPAVATVNANGRIQAITPGNTRIIVQTASGLASVATVTVKPANIIHLPSALKTVSENAFKGTQAEIYVLPDGVQSIEDGAFTNLTKARLIVVPNDMTDISPSVFENTPAKFIYPDGTPIQ